MTDYGAPQGGMGQMIQMLSVLAEMQDRRKQMALDQQKFEAQRDQFAQTLGVTREDQNYRAVSKIMDTIAQGGASAATAVHELAPLLNLKPEQAQFFAQIAPSAATALQQIQTKGQQFALDQQQQGLASMTPEQRQQAQQAAYLNQNAGGPGAIGGLQTGKLIGQMAGQAADTITPGHPSFDQDMARRMQQAYGAQVAARQDPWSFAVGQAGINSGLAPAAAAIGAGTAANANTMVNDQTNRAQIAAQAQIAALNDSSKGGRPSIAPQDYVSAINALRSLSENMANQKYADKATVKAFKQQYNSLAALVGIGLMNTDADLPQAVGRIHQLYGGLYGSPATPPGPASGVWQPIPNQPLQPRYPQ
jgi:hypothetical protein